MTPYGSDTVAPLCELCPIPFRIDVICRVDARY